MSFEPDTLHDTLQEKFGDVVIAIAMKDDFAFYATWRVSVFDGEAVLSLFPSPDKDFSVPVTGISEDSDRQWSIASPRQTWLLRQPPTPEATEFSESMSNG